MAETNDEQTQAAERKREKLFTEGGRDAFRAVMATPEGHTVIKSILLATEVWPVPSPCQSWSPKDGHTDALHTAYNCGRADIGYWLIEHLIRFAPAQFEQMALNSIRETHDAMRKASEIPLKDDAEKPLDEEQA